MVRVHRLERLGNLLSQYCFARVLASRFSYTLDSCPIAGFSGSRKQIDGEDVLGPEVMWTGHWPADAYSGRKLGQAELLQPPGAKVMLSGFFQRFEYIADIREEVREDWLRMDDPLPVRPSGDFAICLRLGGGDDRAGEMEDGKGEVQREDGALHEAEVRRLARMVPHERLYIVTDEPGHPMIESLKDLHPIIQTEGGTAGMGVRVHGATELRGHGRS